MRALELASAWPLRIETGLDALSPLYACSNSGSDGRFDILVFYDL